MPFPAGTRRCPYTPTEENPPNPPPWKMPMNGYEKLWVIVDKFMEEIQPCQIKDGSCLRYRLNRGANFCCEGCPHLIDSKCSVKALQCRLWICPSIFSTLSPEIQARYKDLQARVMRAGYWTNEPITPLMRRVEADFE